MAIKSGFFNSVNGDRRYDADFFAEFFGTLIGNGVFPDPSTGLQVVRGEGMSVGVKVGKGWVEGHYITVFGADYNLQLDVADGVLKRIDRIVLRLTYSGRKIIPVVKKGTFASTPVAPNLQRDADVYELTLADVLINPGTTQIIQANITDNRFNKELCGIVKGTVDGIDTTDLFAQYDDSFRIWFETIKDILDENVAASLANGIAALEIKKADLVALQNHENNAVIHKTSQQIRSESTTELRTEVVNSLPASPQKGRIVFHSDTIGSPKFKGYDGAKWV